MWENLLRRAPSEAVVASMGTSAAGIRAQDGVRAALEILSVLDRGSADDGKLGTPPNPSTPATAVATQQAEVDVEQLSATMFGSVVLLEELLGQQKISQEVQTDPLTPLQISMLIMAPLQQQAHNNPETSSSDADCLVM